MSRTRPFASRLARERPAGLQPILLSTDDVGVGDRFEWWRTAFGGLHKVEVEPSRRAGFAASGEHWRLGSNLIGKYRTSARRVVRTADDIRRDDIDHWVLRVARRGMVVSRGADASFRAFAGQVAFGTFGASYHDDYSAGEWVCVLIPRDSLPALEACRTGVYADGKAGLLADFLLSLDRRLPETLAADLPAVTEMTRTMISGCLLGGEGPGVLTQAERLVVLREGVERVIRDNIGSARLDVGRICELAGVSRSVLYRLFEDRGGVAAHVQALRLRGIHAELNDPFSAGETVARLAARWGLHNAASFSRAFRQAYGCTPREARTAARHFGSPPRHGARLRPDRAFVDLLR